MVHIPILKIDVPEPSIQELLPGLVHLLINSCTRVFDMVHDYLRPLTPEQEMDLYSLQVAHLPREFRLARKKVLENNIVDPDKMSEEFEDAGYAYYRRRMREMVAGYSDEDSEDVTFRRLMSPYNARLHLHHQPLQQSEDELEAAGSSGQTTFTAAAAPPSRTRRVTVTTVAGGAGLAIGAGVVKLVHMFASRLRRKKKPKRRAPQQAAGRRQSEQGTRSSSSRRGTPRSTPTSRQR